MAMVNKVKLNICGTEYSLTTDEPEGYIQELGAQLDMDMRNLMGSDNRVSLLMAAVMTALVKSDEAKKSENAADHLRAQMKDYLDDNARCRQEAEAARREVERLRREIEELHRRLAAPRQ